MKTVIMWTNRIVRTISAVVETYYAVKSLIIDLRELYKQQKEERPV